MTKFLLFIFTLALGGLSYFQYQKIDDLDTQVHILRTSLQESQKTQAQLQAELNQQKSQISTDQATLQKQRADQLQRLSSLRAQAMLEEQRLAALKKNIQNIEAQKKNGGPTIDSEMKRDQDLLKDIENRIKYYDSAQKEVTQNSGQALKLRQAEEKTQLQQINDNLKLQNQLIKQTQDDIKFWQKKKHDPNQNNRLDELTTQLQAQQANLLQIQGQRKEVADQLAQNTAAINAESGAERDELKSTQGQLQSQALNVRTELQHLQDQKNRGQKDVQSKNDQIHSLQDQVGATNAKLKSLYDEINSLERATSSP